MLVLETEVPRWYYILDASFFGQQIIIVIIVLTCALWWLDSLSGVLLRKLSRL